MVRNTDTPPGGLRAHKKRLTRQNIVDTAADLFARRGYDAVTVSEVARAAGVSEQTVYNYFPTKEHLVFDLTDDIETSLLGMITDRPAGTSLLDAVRTGMGELIDRAVRSPSPGGMPRLVAVSPALRRSLLDVADRLTETLADALVAESGSALARPTARILAGSIIAVFTTIIYELGRPDSTEPASVEALRQAVDSALDQLGHGLTRL